MSPGGLLAMASAAGAAATAVRDAGSDAVGRLRAAMPSLAAVRVRRRRLPTPRTLAALGAGAAAALLVGGLAGLLSGVAVATLLARLLGRLPDGVAEATRAARRAELPLALDLMAAALTAGVPLSQAVDAVSRVLTGSLADDLRQLAGALRLGAAPERAAERLAAAGPPFPAVARAFGRADESGSRLAVQLVAIADAERVAAHGRVLEAARRVGVLAVAPLGACFLPAFVLVGVVPVVVGAARDLVL